MNKLVASIQLHNEEVTSVTINETENTLVTGFRVSYFLNKNIFYRME